MTITLSMSPRTEASLKRDAEARGKALEQYAAELLERAAEKSHVSEIPPEQSTFERWSTRSGALIAKMREYARRLPPGHVLDDSRERIYFGRGG